MGQKVNPIGFRLGTIYERADSIHPVVNWNSHWYAERGEYRRQLNNDLVVRDFLRRRLAQASVSRIQIERRNDTAEITIHTARPGIVIGKKGNDIEQLRRDLSRLMGLKIGAVKTNIEEIHNPEVDAYLVAESVAQQLEGRIMYRRAMKRVVQNAMRLGVQGIKLNVAGRLNGAEIARSEWYREGRVPLHTLRADIDYGFAEARTTYGVIGVKAWIFNGEVGGPERSSKQSRAPKPGKGADPAARQEEAAS